MYFSVFKIFFEYVVMVLAEKLMGIIFDVVEGYMIILLDMLRNIIR
jgi:hypothetical protein